MSTPAPLRFEPIYKPRIWGGNEFERLFDRELPPGAPIGESWELVSLPGDESRVADGPLAGRTLRDLCDEWGPALLGGAALIDGRFPLLIKLLDARQILSIQVHPRPANPGESEPASASIKHEAWFVIAAEPGATLFIGLKPGVTPSDLERCAGQAGIVDLLDTYPARPGDCFYLPSGVPHALGAGIVVAEVQTPSDVTYRLYDWDRVGPDGRPRELHLRDALANVLWNVPKSRIVQPRSHVAGPWATVTKLCRSEKFTIDRVRLMQGLIDAIPHTEPAVWIILAGSGVLRFDGGELRFSRGQTLLLPARARNLRVETTADCDLLEVMIPVASNLPASPHPNTGASPGASPLVTLTQRGQ